MEPSGSGVGGTGLRYGLMIRSLMLHRWQSEVLDALSALDGVTPALLIVDDRPHPGRGVRERMRRLGSSKHLLWDIYNNGWVARRAESLRPVDRTSDMSGIPEIRTTVERRGFSEYFPDDVVREIRSHDLDFILRFAFGIIRGSILDASRHGIWSFHHGDEMFYRGSPPAFWELVDDRPVSGAMLQRLTDRLDAGVVLDKGWFRTTQHSYVRNTDNVHLGATCFPARIAAQILRGGSPTGGLEASTSTAPVFKRPTNAETARFLVTQSWRAVTHQLRALTESDHWRVGVLHAPMERLSGVGEEAEVSWLPLDEPGEAYAADPFVVPGSEPALVLYERFDARRRVGEIWQAPVDGSASPSPAGLPVTAHASYPFCFRHDDRTFCLPQVSADGVPLFEWVDRTWRHVVDLLPGEQVLDPTVVHHKGGWWLFGTLPGPRSLDQLHIWSAPELLGPWTPHHLNPVKTDVRSARPAGTPFLIDGRLYRPAQDCSRGYGDAVAMCRVEHLDRERFTEVVEWVLKPPGSWGSTVGMHTASVHGDVTLVDANRRVFDRHASLAELSARVRLLRRR